MATADAALETRARQAYETGRWMLGLRHAAAVVPMAALSLIACGRPTATVTGAIVLAAVVVVCEWNGRQLGRGSRIGLLAGLVPLLVPVILETSGRVCGSSLCSFYPAACLGGGVVAGALLIQWCRWRRVGAAGMCAAGTVAGLAGTLGCLVAGLSGLLALAVGLGLGAVPVLAWRRAA